MEHHSSVRYGDRIANNRHDRGYGDDTYATNSYERYGPSNYHVDHDEDDRIPYHDVRHKEIERINPSYNRSSTFQRAHNSYDEFRQGDFSTNCRKYYDHDEGSVAQEDEPYGRVALDYRGGQDSYDEDHQDVVGNAVYDTEKISGQSYDVGIVTSQRYTSTRNDTSMMSGERFDKSTFSGTIDGRGMATRGYDRRTAPGAGYTVDSTDCVVDERRAVSDGRYAKGTTRDAEYDRGHKVRNSGANHKRGHEKKVGNEIIINNKAAVRSSKRREKKSTKRSAPSSTDYAKKTKSVNKKESVFRTIASVRSTKRCEKKSTIRPAPPSTYYAKEMKSINEKALGFREMCRNAFSCRE